MLKIAIVTTRYLQSDMRGNEEIAKNLAEGLNNYHDITVITSNALDSFAIKGMPLIGRYLNYEGERKINNIRVIYFPVTPIIGGWISALSRLLKKIFSTRMYSLPIDISNTMGFGPFSIRMFLHLMYERYDLIYSSAYPTTTSFLALIAALKTHTPFVFTPFYHYKLEEFNKSRTFKYIISKSTAIIACTEKERTELMKKGATSEQLFTVPLGINSSKIDVRKSDFLMLSKKLDLNGKFIILANPWQSKGINTLLKALSELSRKYNNLALLTIGNPDSEYLKIRKKMMNASNLIIKDLGWVTGKLKWECFAICDVFVMPSISDAFGLSYLEAWVMRKPVIGLSGTSAEDLIKNGINGFLIKKGDSQMLEKYLEVLILSPELKTSLGKAGRKFLTSKYTLNRFIAEYKSIFEKVGVK